MSLSNDELLAINNAAKAAIEALNTDGQEIIYPIQENINIVRDILIHQRVPQKLWENQSIWLSGFVAARKDGALIQRPTREEIVAERNRRDREDGSPRVQAQARRDRSQQSHKSDYEAAQQWARESLEMLRDPTKFQKQQDQTKQTAEATFNAEQKAILESLPVDLHFGNFSPEQRRQFCKLIQANIRLFNIRQAAYQRAHESD